MHLRRLLLFLLGCVVACTDAGGEEETLLILSAASAQDVCRDVASSFEARTGLAVEVAPGPSSGHARSILEGAPATIFLSAHTEWATRLERAGRVLARKDLLANTLVLVVPHGFTSRIRHPRDLLEGAGRYLALAGPSVPAGRYGEQALENLGLLGPLEKAGRIVRGQDARSVLSFVERGEAEGGVVYATDADIVKAVDVAFTFPKSSYEPIIYSLLLLKGDHDDVAARALFDAFLTPEAARVFRRRGFRVVAKATER